MTSNEQPAIASQLLVLDGGSTDAITPRDLFRAMCIASAMGEDRMAARLREQLETAFAKAGVDFSILATHH